MTGRGSVRENEGFRGDTHYIVRETQGENRTIALLDGVTEAPVESVASYAEGLLARALPGQSVPSEAFLLPQSAELFAHVLRGADESSWLVPSHNRRAGSAPMSADALGRAVADGSERAGRRITCHQLQLSGAIEALRKGESMESVLQRLGRKTWRSEIRRAAEGLH
jgi:hypothetical protein